VQKKFLGDFLKCGEFKEIHEMVFLEICWFVFCQRFISWYFLLRISSPQVDFLNIKHKQQTLFSSDKDLNYMWWHSSHSGLLHSPPPFPTHPRTPSLLTPKGQSGHVYSYTRRHFYSRPDAISGKLAHSISLSKFDRQYFPRIPFVLVFHSWLFF